MSYKLIDKLVIEIELKKIEFNLGKDVKEESFCI